MVLPLAGVDFSAAIHSVASIERQQPLFWEHEGNEAVRENNIKLVKDYLNADWEMYNLSEDPTELNNLYPLQQQEAEQLLKKYEQWKSQTGVVDWDGPKQELDSMFISWFGAPLEIR